MFKFSSVQLHVLNLECRRRINLSISDKKKPWLMCVNEQNVIQDIPDCLKVGCKMRKETNHPKKIRLKKIKANKRQVLLDRVSI